MVLPRAPKRAVLEGWTTTAAAVRVGLDCVGRAEVSMETTTASPTNHTTTPLRWQVTLPPLRAAAVNCTLTVRAISSSLSDNTTRNETIVVRDVAVGDVFLCAGQSNMEMTVGAVLANTSNAVLRQSSSSSLDKDYFPPHVRLFTVAKRARKVPANDVTSKSPRSSWDRSNAPGAVMVDGDYWNVYSATCFYAGVHLYRALNANNNSNTHEIVPIGLITTAWGGQKIQTFMSPDALRDDTCGGTRSHHKESIHDTNTKVPPRATHIWNGMIHALRNVHFAGVMWYQGEANSRDFLNYTCQFPALIADWQQHHFGNSPQTDNHNNTNNKLPFVYVQLAGFVHGMTWPAMRAAQDVVLTTLPNVGRAVAVDLADPTSPLGAIHPRRKYEVGRRVALQMIRLLYDINSTSTSGMAAEGPVLADVRQGWDDPSGHYSVKVQFEPETAHGLHLADAAACTECCDRQSPFQVMHGNGTWARVPRVTVTNNTAFLFLDKYDTIMGVRYAWDAQPECALYNGKGGPDDHSGLTAAPFEWCADPSGEGAWTGRGCRHSVLTDIASAR